MSIPLIIWSSEFAVFLMCSDQHRDADPWPIGQNYISKSYLSILQDITDTVSLLSSWPHSPCLYHGPQSLQDSMGMSERTGNFIRKKIIFTSFGVMSSLSKTVRKCILTKSWVMPWLYQVQWTHLCGAIKLELGQGNSTVERAKESSVNPTYMAPGVVAVYSITYQQLSSLLLDTLVFHFSLAFLFFHSCLATQLIPSCP